jgi:hypothetical protein
LAAKFEIAGIFSLAIGAYKIQRRGALATKFHAIRIVKPAFSTMHNGSTWIGSILNDRLRGVKTQQMPLYLRWRNTSIPSG